MNLSEHTQLARLKTKIMVASDALSRADDGLTENAWETGRLDYAARQMLKANKAIVEAFELLNAWLNQNREPNPAEEILPDRV